MKYEDLKRVLEEENKSTLSRISRDFYSQAHTYIKEMEDADRSIPRRHSEEAVMIQYELKNALSIVDKIFNKRTRKIIKMASGKAFSKNPSNIAHDADNMTPEEKDIYYQVLEAILSGKKNTIEPILGLENEAVTITHEQDRKEETTIEAAEDRELSTPDTEDPSVPVPENDLTAAPPDEKAGDTDENGKKDLNKEYIVVRILKDVPTFIGTDGRNYTLNCQDVAVLPKINANALVKRKVAVPIKSTL